MGSRVLRHAVWLIWSPSSGRVRAVGGFILTRVCALTCVSLLDPFLQVDAGGNKIVPVSHITHTRFIFKQDKRSLTANIFTRLSKYNIRIP